MGKGFTFTMDVEVDDEEVLFDHAMKVATTAATGALTEDNARDLLRSGGHIDVRACVQMVLDPGESPPGLSLIESSAFTDLDESIFNVDFGDERN